MDYIGNNKKPGIKDFWQVRNFKKEYWPENLRQIPEPPVKLRIVGNPPPSENKILCVIGPRKYSDYSRLVCEKLISGLAGYPITIVSGLAYGIDSIAHRVAVENKIHTMAVPGSGLDQDVIYPRAHLGLAREIVSMGGCLISEFPDNFTTTNWAFPQRNRIMAGIADATLVIETREKSGTMITTRLTLDYNHDLMTVPGSIFDKSCAGTNFLIQEGAICVTCAEDVLEALGIADSEQRAENSGQRMANIDLSSNEKLILEILTEPMGEEKILAKTNLTIAEFNEALTLLEMKDLIYFAGGKICQK